MDGKLEAIETFYAGRMFRSRKEARHAIADADDISRQAYIKATGKAPPVRH